MRTDWRKEAKKQAVESVEHVLDDVIQSLLDFGELSKKDIIDYDADYHQEVNQINPAASIMDATRLIVALSEYEELGPFEELRYFEDIVSVIAASTFGAAVAHYFQEALDEIETDPEVCRLVTGYNSLDDGSNKSENELRQIADTVEGIKKALEKRCKQVLKAFSRN